MDYAIQTRLKIFAETEVIDAPDDVELIQSLTMPDYKAKNERAMILHVTAYDWNCPQHITPRFTLAEIEPGTQTLRSRIIDLEAEVARRDRVGGRRGRIDGVADPQNTPGDGMGENARRPRPHSHAD